MDSNNHSHFSSPLGMVTNLSEAQIHIFTTILTLLLPIVTAFYVHNDYRAFISLGPGGTPSTPLGYLKIKTLSLISLRDPYRPLPIPPHFRPQTGYLTSLPSRPFPRPLVQGIAPQRQQTQKSTGKLYTLLVSRLQELARDPENMLIERTSCFEKHSSGLFATSPITRTCGGEICHAHPSDGSLHLTLHPADAKLVLEHGLGERHPLAKGGWYRRFVPREFVLIYAPRSQEEVDVVMKVVAAAVWWVSGVDVNVNAEGEDAGGKARQRSADVAAIGKAMESSGCGACSGHACGGSQAEKLTGLA